MPTEGQECQSLLVDGFENNANFSVYIGVNLHWQDLSQKSNEWARIFRSLVLKIRDKTFLPYLVSSLLSSFQNCVLEKRRCLVRRSLRPSCLAPIQTYFRH